MHLNNISNEAAILPWVPNSGAVCVWEKWMRYNMKLFLCIGDTTFGGRVILNQLHEQVKQRHWNYKCGRKILELPNSNRNNHLGVYSILAEHVRNKTICQGPRDFIRLLANHVSLFCNSGQNALILASTVFLLSTTAQRPVRRRGLLDVMRQNRRLVSFLWQSGHG